MQGKYKVITLCGSARFEDDFIRVQKQLSVEGNIVLSPLFFSQSDDKCFLDERVLSETKKMLGDMHKRKIDMADEIFVINKGGYIGESTEREIAYARFHNKPIAYME